MSLPLQPLTSYEEIEQLLRDGQIKKFSVDPKLQFPGNSNTYMTFITHSGQRLISKVLYNRQTNEIFPPFEIPFEITRGESLVDWAKARSVFSDKQDYLPKIPRGYSDSDIEGEVGVEELEVIFDEIREFESGQYKYFLQTVETLNGEAPALVRQWTNGKQRLQLCITNENPSDYQSYGDKGWALIYGSPTTFLVIGIFNSHPFVFTPGFTFDNSDGSTDVNFESLSISLDELKDMLVNQTLDFLFDQVH